MDNQTPVFVSTFPTPKEQIVSGVIGIGLTVATLVVVAGSFYVAGKVQEKIQDLKTKKTQQTAE